MEHIFMKADTNALDQAENKLSASKHKIKEAYHLASEAATDALDGVKEEAEMKYDEGKYKADELTATVMNYVKEKPIASIGIAFAAGWLFSKITK